MPSKFTKDVERCLELIKKETGINVRVSNDDDKYFIIDDKGHSFGHGEPYRRLYSSVYFCSEILSFMKSEETRKIMESEEQGNI
tara:strand:+ start:39 stop:290 length:252 start_codon:yes stop_codon:yes gene_type:complete